MNAGIPFNKDALGLFPELETGTSLPFAKLYLSKVREFGLEALASATGPWGRKVRNGSAMLLLSPDGKTVTGYSSQDLFMVTDTHLEYTADLGRYLYNREYNTIEKSWYINIDNEVPAETNVFRMENGQLVIEKETRPIVSNNTKLAEYTNTATLHLNPDGLTSWVEAEGGSASLAYTYENGLVTSMMHATEENDEVIIHETKYHWYVNDGKVACFIPVEGHDDLFIYMIGNLTYRDLVKLDFGFKVEMNFALQTDSILDAQHKNYLREQNEATEKDATIQ